ncbi:hypothetical protein [Dyadobacter sp.]|uniref:hypothetical protein n=1 Tax=Dyadobacter sp. TaxID=1914288 RepID=UPI003F702A2E
MLKKLLLFAWIGVAVLAVSSCEGPEGPAGPKGDTGAAGPAGPAGPAGEDGTGGGGAVIFSLGEIESTEDGGLVGQIGLDSLSADEIDVYESAVVMVYVKAQGVWWPLPGTVSFGQGKVNNFTFVHGIDKSTFFVDIINLGWSEDVEEAPMRTFEDIRLIFVPGELLRTSAEVNWKDYNEAVKALGFSESSIELGKKLKLLRK